ncbi:MAG: hypothetical protein AUK53_06225 [Betaproteobacteria bacterium CG2_30_59_46]|nr:MAG: hypothetical protein AUK53_06225 [Betaproteobacteria bacterium CG2_30_59_46]PIQ11308.1 MAG: hypothetical protein COW70_12205 [Hydrogenophilales bacterium CG18_big_fil_WC_8_21_14_2_50_58_12]PIY00932.1 MAG: hypothetical protein COZ23_05840 [Hydrogenophilales bacterium CG_4_10_14_3_um_filter_58_23]PJB06515.1 MAG: hypothetical protein CO125_06920 [Hydrogenophilales bacterium CG_4_9_14_3_um_filter_59_35]
MKKILITIQGKTLILHYQVKHGLVRKGSGWASYIQVLPSAELARFDLKGLTLDMFCVNISDMVNIRGLFSGQVENERQVPVARWEINHEDYLHATSTLAAKLTHLQIVNLLASLSGYIQETDNQFIDFEGSVVPHETGEHATFSGYRLTIVTEDIEDKVAPYAYYNLDTHTPEGWQGYPPPQADYEPIRIALENKLQAIREAGVQITQVDDETDYAIAS